MTQQEAFNTIKRVVDLSLQNGVIKTIEESKIVFDSLAIIFESIEKKATKDEISVSKSKSDIWYKRSIFILEKYLTAKKSEIRI